MNRIFALLKTFSFITLALIALALLLLVSFCARESTTRHKRQQTHLVQADASNKTIFTLSKPHALSGTNYAYIGLEKPRTGYSDSSLKGYYGNSYTDLLFIDTQTGENRWLFDSTDKLTIFQLSVLADATQQINGLAVQLVLGVIERDSNNDGALRYGDKLSVMAVEPNGSHLRTLVAGIDKIHTCEQLRNNRVMIVYEKDQKTYISIYEGNTLNQIALTQAKPIGE